MRKTLVVVLVLGLSVLLTPGATALAAPQHLTARFTTLSTPPGPPIGCPVGYEDGWVIGSSGSGQMTSPVYTGDVVVTERHCSRWQVFDPQRTTGVAVGQVAAGRLTITAATDTASTLVLAFDGTFQLVGDPSGPSSFDTHITLRYRAVDGTGAFAGATGSGHLVVTGNVIETGELVGSLVVR